MMFRVISALAALGVALAPLPAAAKEKGTAGKKKRAAKTQPVPVAVTHFKGVESIVRLVPEDFALRTEAGWNTIALQRAAARLTEGALDQVVTLKLQVKFTESYTEDGFAYRLKAEDTVVTVAGQKMQCGVWLYFRPHQADAVARVMKGDTISASGIVHRADIQDYDGTPWLSIDVGGARMAKR